MAAYFDDDRPCTIEELERIITAPSNGFVMLPDTPYDEITEGIYIGEGDSASSINCMKRLGVTHVLNAALGKDKFHVNTNHVMYNKAGMQFMGIEATDFINCDLSKHFEAAAEFIEACVQGGGKVFVHCVQGVSRSATLVLAFLMIKRHMTVQDALRLARSKREVCPNPGFLQQLCQLDEQLKKQRQSIDSSLQKRGEKNGEYSNFSASCGESPVCSVQQIEDILTEPADGCIVMPTSVYSQIDKHIFIGEGKFALDVENLRRLQVTHVLNAAQCKGINSDPKMYTNAGLNFLGVKASDRVDYDISEHFEVAADFIESAVKANGRVYVHCVMGVSRSATLVLAYYMLKQSMDLPTAIRLVRAHREICPNSDFLQQLCELNGKLAQERKLKHSSI